MNKPRIVIAVCSPTEKSEPFIEHIKHRINGENYFFYGDILPKYAVQYGSLSYYPNLLKRQSRKIGKLVGKKYDSPLIEGIKIFLKKKKIQIVLSEFGYTGAKMASICEEFNIPHIVHFHGGDAYIKNNLDNFRTSYLNLFKQASAIIAVSEDMKADLIKLGSIKEKTIVIPYGPDERFFNINAKFLSPTFLFVGRLVDKKAPYYLLFSFQKVLKEIPNAKLLIIGDGILYNAMKNMINLLKLNKSINLLKWIDYNNLFSYFEKSCCYVQHSIIAINGDAEGTPNSILEAQASGLPVISTNHKGIKQAVIHGITGYLVNEHDVESMANYMIEIGQNLLKSKKMGKNARQHVLKNYSMEKYISSINNLINKTLKNEI